MMAPPATAIAYLDGPRLLGALSAGVRLVFRRRDYLNKINVFPVPDGDTGTNMAFTFKSILDATVSARHERIDDLMAHIADAALDGARGNSGAIMAQFFHGFSEAISGSRLLTASGFAQAAAAGSLAAWKAMSKPVPGTLPTVLEDFANELAAQVAGGIHDIRLLIEHGLARAHKSLANTPNQLAALRQAGVVDAGGQGFVDLLEGIWTFIEKGAVDEAVPDLVDFETRAPVKLELGEHRFCTECLITGADIDRDAIMRVLMELDSSSLVVAGGGTRVRVHIHVNNPGDVFLALEKFGTIKQQKADDMRRQHGLMNQPGTVAIVTDSGADIPPSEIERLGINMVPVRLSFGDREFLDGISLTSQEFYAMLAESQEAPLTSQPPMQDFSRVYSLLTSHGYEVISIGLSAQLSGTTAAAMQAAGRQEPGKVRVFDSLSATAGQGLLAIAAAEAAELGFSGDEIEALLSEWVRRTNVIAVADDLCFAVKGGRVPGWVKRLTDLLHINPVLMASSKGRLTLGGFHRGRGARPAALARSVVRKMKKEQVYRVLVAHANHPEGAAQVRRHILGQHGAIHSCHVTDAGPAIGVHLGPGGLIVGFMQQPEVLQ